jgi:HEAT repeat protein
MLNLRRTADSESAKPMTSANFSGLSPSDHLRRLCDFERAASEGQSTHLNSLVETFRDRLKSVSSSEIVALLAQAIDSPATEDECGYWCCISELHHRAEAVIFEACAAWAASPEPRTRKASADVLSQLGYREEHPFAQQSQPILERLLEDNEIPIVEAALIALGHLGVGELSAIAGCAKRPEAQVREAGVRALLSRDEPMARRMLIDLSRDAEPEVRDWATFGLGTCSKIDSPEIRAALVARLADEDDETRGEALFGLAKRKDPRVLPAISRELVRDEVSERAIEAAGQMPHESLLPALEALLSSSPGDKYILDAIAACRGVAR